ncbi:MAG: ABC transporter substrate-binding protein [Burkholderiales bacterium]|jgi:iron complex transport system substrate-binding protein|nr:ABC transporter substrate-binding protein [Burkholderiales bacterium]
MGTFKERLPYGLLGLLAIIALVTLLWLLVPVAGRSKTDSPSSFPGTRESGITLIDQNGATLHLNEAARRVIVIPIPMASMMMAIDGSAEKIYGMNAAAKTDLTDGLLGRMFPDAMNISTEVAGENFIPNSEALAREHPDLVMQWGDRSDAIIQPIKALGMPVLGFRYGDSLLAAEWLEMIGSVIGKPTRAHELSSWFRTRVREITDIAATIPDAEKPRVVYLIRAKAALMAVGKSTSMDSDIRRVGGINPATALPPSSTVDIEQLLRWNPDIVLLNNFEPGLSPDFFYNDPRFAEMNAVKSRRVYLYPRGGFRWDPPSQETPLATEWLFKVLHPKHADKTGDLRSHIKAAYQFLYRYSVSESEIDEILQTEKNIKSALYAELFAPLSPQPSLTLNERDE